VTEARSTLARYRMSRAQECLEDAKLLFANGKYHSTANRAYYASFYAVRALLHSKGSMHRNIQALSPCSTESM
jgi:uncharacterized protein (UPF0332 family)